MLRAAHEVGLQPKIFGGGMVGLQFTSVMTSMGPMLNGVVNYDFWAPEPTMLAFQDRKSTRLNSSHDQISYAVFCLKKKKPARGAGPPRAARPPPDQDIVLS